MLFTYEYLYEISNCFIKLAANNFSLCVDIGKFNNIVYERKLSIFCQDINQPFIEH